MADFDKIKERGSDANRKVRGWWAGLDDSERKVVRIVIAVVVLLLIIVFTSSGADAAKPEPGYRPMVEVVNEYNELTDQQLTERNAYLLLHIMREHGVLRGHCLASE